MERQLLITIFISILFFGCQQVEVSQNIKKDTAIKETANNLISKPDYEDIWSYIKQNNAI